MRSFVEERKFGTQLTVQCDWKGRRRENNVRWGETEAVATWSSERVRMKMRKAAYIKPKP